MKAIKVTAENKELNPKHLKDAVVGEWKLFSEGNNFPKSWNKVMPFNAVAMGFLNVVNPTLTEGQIRGEMYHNTDLDVATYYVNDAPIKTAQELYDALILEGETVFDEYRKMLSEAASPYVILSSTPIELQQLTQALLDAKVRILIELDLNLTNNDLAKLNSFTYQTAEAEQLKEAIKNFK